MCIAIIHLKMLISVLIDAVSSLPKVFYPHPTLFWLQKCVMYLYEITTIFYLPESNSIHVIGFSRRQKQTYFVVI